VIEFLKPFQNKEPTMTTAIAYDVLALCDEFEIDCFRQFVQEFIGIDKHEAIIDGIKRNFERSSGATPLERELREDFIQFVEKDRLFELPFNCLVRNAVLPPSPTPDQIDKFLDFILRSLDHYGPTASILLKGIDPHHLSVSQIRRLLQRRGVIWSFFGEFSTVPMMGCLNSHAELRQQIELA
jgi:hypothetical protein